VIVCVISEGWIFITSYRSHAGCYSGHARPQFRYLVPERKLCGKPGWKFRVQYKKDGHLNFGVERTDVGGVFFNVFVYLDYQ
jgi:hypothetical protein